MTIGIYRLIFPNTDKCYIGQSVNIERRYMQHLRSFELGSASGKLQSAYDVYGKPKLDILLDDIALSDLDTCENEAIEIFDSFRNGFNQLEHAEDGPSSIKFGVANGNSKYDELQLYNALILMAQPNIPLAKIEKITGVHNDTLSNIASGKGHTWLFDKYPSEYVKILRGNRKYSYNSTGNSVPKILSPAGDIFYVENQREFARNHNLNHSSLSKVLRGVSSHHKGWKLYE